MNRKRPVVLVLMLMLGLMALAIGQEKENLFQPEPHPEYVPGEVLVKFKSDVSARALTPQMEDYGVQPVREYSRINLVRYKLGRDVNMEATLEELRQDPNVEYAEPNYIYHILETTPNDSRYSEQWALNNTGLTGGVSDADIDAPEAWDTQQGSRDIIVGVIDTGIDYNHPDLAANMWRNPGESGNGRENNGVDDDGNGFIDDVHGWDFINNDNDPMDDNSHGTHVAGIIGAVGNNGRGVSGANWNVSLVGLKFLSGSGSGNTGDAIEAILYAADMGFHILNNSWGGGGFSQSLADAIETANQAGTLFAAAAGNESRNTDASPNYPSNYESANVLSVASTDDGDNLSSFSNYGRTTVDLAAPGSDILSTVPGNSYQQFSGTSMATPYAAGVAALMMAQFPGIDHVALKFRLMGGTDFKSALINRAITEGRLNAANSLSTAPLITTVKHPHTSETGTPYGITAFIVDDDQISAASLHYSFSGAATGEDSVDLAANGLEYTASIPAQALETTVEYFVKATDSQGNTVTGRTLSFLVTATPPPDNGGGNGGCCGAFAVTIRTGHQTVDTWATVGVNILLFLAIPVFFLRRRR